MDDAEFKRMLEVLDSGNIVTMTLAHCIREAQNLEAARRHKFCADLALGLISHALNDYDLNKQDCIQLFERHLFKIAEYVPKLDLRFITDSDQPSELTH